MSEKAGEPKFVTEHPEEFHKFRGSEAMGFPMCARLLPEEKMCILDIGHDDDAHEREILPWAARIEAAIKRAKKLLGQKTHWISMDFTTVVTATETALAEAFWDVWRSEFEGPSGFNHIPDALIAFTEKVESFDG